MAQSLINRVVRAGMQLVLLIVSHIIAANSHITIAIPTLILLWIVTILLTENMVVPLAEWIVEEVEKRATKPGEKQSLIARWFWFIILILNRLVHLQFKEAFKIAFGIF